MTIRESLRTALRTHRRHLGFACIAVLAFGLAMSLNTVVYAVIDALVAPHLAIDHPERIVEAHFYEMRARRGQAPLLAAIQEHTNIFDGVTTVHARWGTAVVRGGAYRDANLVDVPRNYFTVIPVRPIAGRLLRAGDVGNGAPGVVISLALRHALFRDDEDPIGAMIIVDGSGAVVVGVIPSHTAYPQEADVWRLDAAEKASPWYLLIARLRAGVTPKQALQALDIDRRRFAAEDHVPDTDTRLTFDAVYEQPFRVEPFHLALIGAVLAVLLVSATNIANLQLTRGMLRRRELMTRAALGATRGALIGQFLAESAVLIVAGLALGLMLAYWGMALVRATVPSTIADYVVEPQWSWRVIVASALAGVLTLGIAGLAPAIRLSRTALGDALRSSPGTGTSRDAKRHAGVLVVVQIALALTLSIGGTLLLRAAVDAETAGDSIDGKHLVEASFTDPSWKPGTAPNPQWEAAMLDRVRSLPEVTDVGAIHATRMPDDGIVAIDDPGGGRVEFRTRQFFSYDIVTPGYLRTIGFRISRGRDFNSFGESVPVAIIGETAARRWWPRADPVGRMLKLGSLASNAPWVKVVGVAPQLDAPNPWGGPDAPEPNFVVSTAASVTVVGDSSEGSGNINVLARVRGDPVRTALAIRYFDNPSAKGRHAVAADSWERYNGIDLAQQQERFIASLFGVFAMLGLGLASLGVYAVTAQAVAGRRREFGVRVALGAQPRDVFVGVLREGYLLGLFGVAAGLLIARFAARLLEGDFLLWRPPLDPVLFGSVAAILLAVVIAASLPSAIRAASVDPAESLRTT